jgi:hypothetical protein
VAWTVLDTMAVFLGVTLVVALLTLWRVMMLEEWLVNHNARIRRLETASGFTPIPKTGKR